MGLVTVFCPAMATGVGELVHQTTGEARLLVDCNVNPVYPYAALLVGHRKRTPGPKGAMVNCGH